MAREVVDIVMVARIIMLNGTSSAGKSTLATALRPLLPASFCYYASDQLADAGFRPLDSEARWQWRNAFFDGFHRSIAAFAAAGLDLLVEHIVEHQTWADELTRILSPFDVYWVAVHASPEVLDYREKLRGNRAPGEAREHLGTHTYCRYDLEIDTSESPIVAAEHVVRSWASRGILERSTVQPL